MADNPITYTEIDAYCRLTDAHMQPWEAKAIISLYWAYRGAVPKPKGKDDVRNETDVNDGAGIRALMAGMGAKKAKSE